MVLVTGGTGFLGSTLIEYLLQKGESVRAIKRKDAKIPVILEKHPHLEWVEADLVHYFELETALVGVKQVYHCAAYVALDPSAAKKMRLVNVEGTANVVNLCIENRARLLHVSSIAAIGAPQNLKHIADEKDLWVFDGMQHAYSISKYEAEMEVWRGIEEGLDAVIINPSLILGASAGIKGSGAIFLALHKGLGYYTKGTVALVDVVDVANIAILLMNNMAIRGERFIVNNVNLKNKDFLGMAASALKKSMPQKEAKDWMLAIAWRFLAVKSWLTGKPARMTKDSAKASLANLSYSNLKITQQLNYTFKPIRKTIEEVGQEILNMATHGAK